MKSCPAAAISRARGLVREEPARHVKDVERVLREDGGVVNAVLEGWVPVVGMRRMHMGS